MLHKAQLDRFAGQQPQRPVVVTFGDGTAGNGNQMGLLFAGEGRAPPFLPPVVQDGIYKIYVN